MAFDLGQYLERIRCDGPVTVSEETLVRLHEAQALSIPFENIDVRLHRGIDLNPETLFNKLVANRRGGYCFELNGLLYQALKAVGFSVQPLLARVAYNRPEPGPRTHETLLVTLGDRQWLADVGFGGPGLRRPLPFELGRIETQDGSRYRLDERDLFVLQKELDGNWVDLYLFNTEEARPMDLEMSNFFTSSHPTSIFRQNLICTMPDTQGRKTLRNRTFSSGERSSEIDSPSKLAEILHQEFGLKLDDAMISQLPLE